MHLPCCHPKALARLPGDPRKQRGGIMSVQPIQGASQAVVMQELGGDPGPNRCSTGLVAKNCETRYNWRLLKPSPFKIIATVAVPTLTCCSLGPASCIQIVCQPNLLAHAGHDPQMIQPFTPYSPHVPHEASSGCGGSILAKCSKLVQDRCGMWAKDRKCWCAVALPASRVGENDRPWIRRQ